MGGLAGGVAGGVARGVEGRGAKRRGMHRSGCVSIKFSRDLK